MAKPTLPDFVANRNLIALKISSSELSGFFTKKLTLPKDTSGLAVFGDGSVALFTEGQEVAGRFDLVLVKSGEIPLRHPLHELRSADGFAIHATVGLAVSIQTGRADLFKDFTKSFFSFTGAYTLSEFRAALFPEVQNILSEFAAARKAAELHQCDRFRDVEALLRERLERVLFGTGVRLERIVEVHFAAPDYAERAAAEARKRDDDRRREEKIERKEERLRRFASFLNDSSIQQLLAQLPDDRAKGLFYAKLMEDDSGTLSPKELVGKLKECGDEVAELVYKAMEGLLGGTASVDPHSVGAECAEFILVAAGSKVLVFNPAELRRKPREFQFRDPIRSVRCIDTAEGPVLLVGSKRTVHTVGILDGDCLEYALPADRQPRGGVNAVAAHGAYLYATHSEYGLARWERAKPSAPAELLWPEITAKHRTTRGVQVAGDRLLFASGDRVYSAALGNGHAAPAPYPAEADSPVTALATGGGRVFAGTERGAILCWKLDGSDRGSVFVRRKEPIVNLRLANVCSIPHLFYSTKDLSVRARVVGQTLETSYESGGASVGVLDAASDLVCASDAAGHRVLLWKVTTPARPSHEVDMGAYSDKPILDLWMKKAKGKPAEPAPGRTG